MQFLHTCIVFPFCSFRHWPINYYDTMITNIPLVIIIVAFLSTVGEKMRNSILDAYAITTINSTCIKCVFYDEPSQGCVVVIHPKASLLSTSSHIGLINIETEYFDRSGDQAEGCINRKSLENNTMVVFLYNKVILGPPVFIRMTQHEGKYKLL